MGDIVEMYRDAVEPLGRDRFACSLATWELLQEVGQTFGWRPIGATYVAPAQLHVESPARRNYRPGSAPDQKRIEHEDAVAWASALELAKDSPHLAAMIMARAAAIKAADGPVGAVRLPGVMEEFIEFAYGGTFTFVLGSAARP